LKEKTMLKSPAVADAQRPIMAQSQPSLFVRLREAWQRSCAVNELNGLSDRHLRDIGVERREIGSVIDRELARLRWSDLAWHK
jgi:uncharacterized protein YjiS (DUF1127 family)